MRIISRLLRMFTRGGRAGATTRTPRARGMGTATRTRGGGLMSMVRRFLR